MSVIIVLSKRIYIGGLSSAIQIVAGLILVRSLSQHDYDLNKGMSILLYLMALTSVADLGLTNTFVRSGLDDKRIDVRSIKLFRYLNSLAFCGVLSNLLWVYFLDNSGWQLVLKTALFALPLIAIKTKTGILRGGYEGEGKFFVSHFFPAVIVLFRSLIPFSVPVYWADAFEIVYGCWLVLLGFEYLVFKKLYTLDKGKVTDLGQYAAFRNDSLYLNIWNFISSQYDRLFLVVILSSEMAAKIYYGFALFTPILSVAYVISSGLVRTVVTAPDNPKALGLFFVGNILTWLYSAVVIVGLPLINTNLLNGRMSGSFDLIYFFCIYYPLYINFSFVSGLASKVESIDRFRKLSKYCAIISVVVLSIWALYDLEFAYLGLATTTCFWVLKLREILPARYKKLIMVWYSTNGVLWIVSVASLYNLGFL